MKRLWFVVYKLWVYFIFALMCSGGQEILFRFGMHDRLSTCILSVMFFSHLMLAYSYREGDNTWKKAMLMQYRHFDEIFPDYGFKNFIRTFVF